MYTLSETYRTKAEAKAAVKAGAQLHIVRADGTALKQASGDAFAIRGKLDHYKEWTGTARVFGGVVEAIR